MEKQLLAKALRDLIQSAEAYMEYHVKKFYGSSEPRPAGLYPAIERAKAALAELDRP